MGAGPRPITDPVLETAVHLEAPGSAITTPNNNNTMTATPPAPLATTTVTITTMSGSGGSAPRVTVLSPPYVKHCQPPSLRTVNFYIDSTREAGGSQGRWCMTNRSFACNAGMALV